MTASVTFTVPGEPRGKGRPRFARKTGRAYTDAQTASYENLIKLACQAAMEGREPFDGPVAVHLAAFLKIPTTATHKRLAAIRAGDEWPTKRPDIENIAKSALDGMNGVAFGDDSQVVNLAAKKFWGSPPGLTITVSEILP